MVAPVETSANGRLVVPRDRCGEEPVVNVTLRSRCTHSAPFSARKSRIVPFCTLAAYSGPKDRFGMLTIGLNPQLQVQGDYRPGDAAGMVMIVFGANEMAGGENRTQSEWWFPVTRATVEVDGRVVVRDGRLVQ